MTTATIFALAGIILMILGSLPISSPVDLWKLGVAFLAIAFFFGTGTAIR